MRHRAHGVRPTVLVIGGSDSSAGAGLARDLRVLAQLGADALCAVTAVTAQSDGRVAGVHHVPPAMVRAQIETAFETRAAGAIKIGMLGNRACVEAVAASLQKRPTIPVVLDPVLSSSSGGTLLDADGLAALKEDLLPRATIVTPNLPEAAMLLGEEPPADDAALVAQARRILALGAQAVLVKGGHACGDEAVDWLVSCDRPAERLTSPRVRAMRRGTGCALASAIACALARGDSLLEACRLAKALVLAELEALAADH
jgi:hydroxymethylpyrimidine/phosphomethylpyrimidine kinase